MISIRTLSHIFVFLILVFPKYSVARSYNKALLTEAYRDLLLPHHNLSNSPATPTADVEECKQVLQCVLEMTRQANSYIVEDMKVCIHWFKYSSILSDY